MQFRAHWEIHSRTVLFKRHLSTLVVVKQVNLIKAKHNYRSNSKSCDWISLVSFWKNKIKRSQTQDRGYVFGLRGGRGRVSWGHVD